MTRADVDHECKTKLTLHRSSANKKVPCETGSQTNKNIEIKARLLMLSLLSVMTSCQLPGNRMKKFCLFATTIKFAFMSDIVTSFSS